MRAVPQSVCPVCQSSGKPWHSNLRDRLFGAPGEWSLRRCANDLCGILWLDPAPDSRDLPLAYEGYYTHSAGHDDLRDPLRMGARREMVARLLGYPSPADRNARLLGRLLLFSPRRRESALYRWFYLPFVRGGRVLEVGCGAGGQLATLRDSGWNALGIEFDAGAAAAARQCGLDVLEGELRELALPAMSFDAIVMAHVIEHVPDPVGLFSECRRLLKPGGLLISITPNVDSLGHRWYGRHWRGLEPPRHLAVFTPRALALCAQRAEFDDPQVRITARDAANVLLASARIARCAQGERIVPPSAEKLPPLGFRLLEGVERAACAMGLGIGEELVLVARCDEPPHQSGQRNRAQ